MIELNKREESKIYSILCVTPSASGHAIPLLKVASALERRGHKITYATSDDGLVKVKQEYPGFQYVGLKNGDPKTTKNVSKIGPPLELFYESWLTDLRETVESVKPDIIMVDVFCVAAMEVAEEFKIRLIINCPLSIESLTKFGVPNMNNNFGWFGLTVVKPNPITLFLHSKNLLMKRIAGYFTRHLLLVHSFIGLDPPFLLPSNVKLIGLPTDESEPKELSAELKEWLESIRQKKLDIIYVTFGSHVTATQEFVDYMYYGLKKTGKAVLWSLKPHSIPEENSLFYVKDWLPQKDLLKLKQVKVVITHCGFGGLTETISAQKPMLCIPAFGDQPHNSEMVRREGMGLILRKAPGPFGPKKYEWLGYTHEELIQKVNQIVSNPNYELRVKRMKLIGQRSGGIETACQWVEYVGQCGYDHLVDKSLGEVIVRNPITWVKRILLSGAIIGGLVYYFSKNPIGVSSVINSTK